MAVLFGHNGFATIAAFATPGSASVGAIVNMECSTVERKVCFLMAVLTCTRN
jgi:hypothetical protein